MRSGGMHPRAAAATTSALLVGLGVVVGIVLDRWVLRPQGIEPLSALTVEALAKDLALDARSSEALRRRVDSLGAEIALAAAQGSDSLRAAARRAEKAIEEALPEEDRSEFQGWMEGHRMHMMERMRSMGHMHGRSGENGMMGGGEPRTYEDSR